MIVCAVERLFVFVGIFGLDGVEGGVLLGCAERGMCGWERGDGWHV